MRNRRIQALSFLLLLFLLTGCAKNIPVSSDVTSSVRSTHEETTEASIEPTVEPSTEAATEPTTEAATEAATEPVTEAPTEPSTEAKPEPSTEAEPEPTTETPFLDSVKIEASELEDEALALGDQPAAVLRDWEPIASGTAVKESAQAVIDYSNSKDGYIMAKYTASTDKKLKAQVKGPSTTYTYTLTAKEWAAFPLSDGNGTYKVTVFENISGNKYSTVVSASFTAAMENEFGPFTHSNQYVDFVSAPNTVAKAKELVKGSAGTLDKVGIVYDYVVTGLSYDKQKAASVKSGYLPVLDTVLKEKKGICFDYAALMTGMLRSQGIPCKLVVGYAGEVYHAWISVWSEETGWIDSVVYFDGKAWHRMDPTFASSGSQSASIMEYIGDGSNYTAKYFY